MEIADSEIFQRRREERVTIKADRRGGRLRLLRCGQMGSRVRGPWPITPARRGNAGAHASPRNLGFPLGHRFSALRMECG